MNKHLATVSIVIALALASACGGSDRPSQAEISTAIQKTDSSFSKKGADCAAKVIVDSDISDRGLKAIAGDEKNYKPSAADKAVEAKISPAIAKCLT